MIRAAAGFRAAALALLALLMGAMTPPLRAQAPATPVAAPETPEFVYRFRARDTLIQVCRRLLMQPQRWPEIQRRNAIRDPFNIPPDTPVRIPYSWLRLTPDTAIVQAVAGSVTRDGVPVAQGDVLAQGTRVETGADGSVSLAFADQSVITLQKSSALRLERLQAVQGVSDGHSAEIRLESGRAETRVKPKRDVGRFEIVTPVAISAVRGTQFRTAFDPAGGNATTETLEGTVGVGGARETVAVAAGFGTRVEAGGAVLPPVPLLPAPDLQSLPEVNGVARLRVEFPAIARATQYRVQLGADPQFGVLLADEIAAAPSFELSVPRDGEYFLRARGIDALGIEGADATRRFSQHVLPDAPALQAPADGTRFHDGGATLRWAASADAAGYHLQVARDPQFADLVVDRPAAADVSAALTGLPTGTYHWRTAAVNAAGESGAWSERRSFEQRAPAPVAEATRVDRRELRLRWPASPGETYRLQIARDASFARPVVDVTVEGGEYAWTKPGGGHAYVRLQVVPAGGTPEPFGATRRFDMPVPLWLQVLLGSAVVLPALL